MKKIYLLLCLPLLIFGTAKGNNIAVANVSLTDQNALFNYVNVKFDLSWDNSWRTLLVPGNWDAAWVFIKYRVSGGDWHHATLDSLSANHTAPSGSQITPALDGKGVFIYRSSTGSGSNNWTNVKLRWKYGTDGVADDAMLEVKVFAIEMVYIPQENYYLGDGNGTLESTASFHQATVDNTSVQITSSLTRIRTDGNTVDDNIVKNLPGLGVMGGTSGGIEYTGDSNIDNPYFPTGHSAFYIMKYEISQEQYADFLNVLTRTQQNTRTATDISGTSVTNRYVMSNTVTSNARQAIRCDATLPAAPTPITVYCDYSGNGVGNESLDGQNVACNYLSWPDQAAYADWAGLRPWTELEFEKICRGPNNAIYGEYVWGSTTLCSNVYTLTNTAAANEQISNLCPATGNAIGINTKPALLIARCGIFAASSVNHTRIETGAAYYGAMEMAGNIMEAVVTVGCVAGRSYQSNHGNGELNSTGDADVDYWPGINGNTLANVANTTYGGTTGVTGYAGMIFKGGGITTVDDHMRPSYRSLVLSAMTSRVYERGGRLARSAP